MKTADDLLAALARLCITHEVVSTGRLTPDEIATARAEGRLYVDDHNMGFVLRPSPQHPENFKYFATECQQKGCQALVLQAELRQWRAGRRP